MNEMADLTMVERVIHLVLIVIAIYGIWKIYRAKVVKPADLIAIGLLLVHQFVYGVYGLLAIDMGVIPIISILASWAGALRIHTIIVVISYVMMFSRWMGVR